jgi:hypothetical protein
MIVVVHVVVLANEGAMYHVSVPVTLLQASTKSSFIASLCRDLERDDSDPGTKSRAVDDLRKQLEALRKYGECEIKCSANLKLL